MAVILRHENYNLAGLNIKKLGGNFTPLGVEIQTPLDTFYYKINFQLEITLIKERELVWSWYESVEAKPRFRQLLCVDQNDFSTPKVHS